MGQLATILGILAGLAGILSAVKSRRTVDAGHQGIKFILGRPVMCNWHDRDTGEDSMRPQLYDEGFVWVVPGLMRLDTVPIFECSTKDETIAAQRPDGATSLIRVNMTYNLEPLGVVRALTEVPDFDAQVNRFFADVVGDVLSELGRGEPREKIRRLIFEAAERNANLLAYGVKVKRISLPELSDTWTTQLVEQLNLPGLVSIVQEALEAPRPGPSMIKRK